MGDQLARAVLADVGAVNMFFAVEPECDGPGWVPVGELGRRADLLAGEVAAVRTALAGASGCPIERVEERVAASLFYQGLASRLLSPVVAAAVAHWRIPDPAGLHWRPDRRGPLVFALGEGTALLPVAAARDADGSGPGSGAPPGDAAALVAERVVDGLLAPVGTALRALLPVAERLLWGNAASALAGAVRSLAEARPALAADARALTAELLARPPLAGLGSVGPAPGHRFTRTTCCLYYRLPSGGVCGDCALAPAAPRRRSAGR
ncbi:(2Fe-2S)-binding protein [Nocardiopsis mangrovi]|uniref:(2Fe-2S)-binding protein n=1 Tax=Nocardiopsis mangrovi TaxID=1179818 RepID=A0ABV9E2T9_9ACTN